MPKHIAPSSVRIATTLEETPFRAWLERHWSKLAMLALAITGGVMIATWMSNQARASADESWDRLARAVDFGSGFAIQTSEAAALKGLAEELGDEQAAAWAKALQVAKLVAEGDASSADLAIAEFEITHKNHPLAAVKLELVAGATPLTLPDYWRQRLSGQIQWEAGHGGLFANPPLPEGSPRVRITTSRGDIEVGLYREKAPRHVENFLGLCSAGFYDGTLFHRVVKGSMVQGGDPNSRNGAPDSWGAGGPDYKLAPEISDLKHFPFALAAANGDPEVGSNGSQFYITTAPSHHLDGINTIFGVVLSGQSVLQAVESGEVTGDRPKVPVEVQSTHVLVE
jgi:peptidyl-prolyl cis-trans isomerase B (cyclophilin B)